MQTRPSRYVALAATATVILGLVACSKRPSGPSPFSSVSVQAVVIRLTAPQDLAPGESVQLTAKTLMSDGSLEDATDRVEWVANSTALAVTPAGLATGVARGRGSVIARFGSIWADATIFVLPKGTFRLAGQIVVCDRGQRPVANATVTVLSGVGTGLTFQTADGGIYELYGVGGPVTVRARSDGYADTTLQVDVTAHQTLSLAIDNNLSGAGCWD